jgi:hypothetical protein
METFADVAKARETYALFAAALNQGREILLRAGIAEAPPPVPEFDAVFRRLNPTHREALFAELRQLETPTTVDALRIWQPLLKRAFAQ